jgi:iron uptake system EfeUOB component EfeO/EfeM
MSKTERIERLEQQVHELEQKLDEQLDAINMLLLDIKDLQQFKRFVELSSASRKSQYDVVSATREMT